MRFLLSIPSLYTYFQEIVGGHKARLAYLENWVCAKEGSRVLDIGCGPGEMVTYFPSCEYTGIDVSEAYIRKANAAYGDKGTFYCYSIDQAFQQDWEPFDLVHCTGVLHHVPDDLARDIARLAAHFLKPEGYFCTLDGCFADGQSFLARTMLKLDRGQFMRTQPEYETILKDSFDEIEVEYSADAFTIPYPSVIFRCRKPRKPQV